MKIAQYINKLQYKKYNEGFKRIQETENYIASPTFIISKSQVSDLPKVRKIIARNNKFMFKMSMVTEKEIARIVDYISCGNETVNDEDFLFNSHYLPRLRETYKKKPYNCGQSQLITKNDKGLIIRQTPVHALS